jgi:hypothetical protein
MAGFAAAGQEQARVRGLVATFLAWGQWGDSPGWASVIRLASVVATSPVGIDLRGADCSALPQGIRDRAASAAGLVLRLSSAFLVCVVAFLVGRKSY